MGADPTLMLTESFRPYFIDDIIGQGRTKKMVGAWLRTGRIPRSILLSGETSAGKTTFARIIARSALCRAPKDGNACTECPSCEAFDKGTHPAYFEMNAASDRGIDSMRDLTRKLSIRPLMGKMKIIVLDEAHMITKQGWNAMLKPLEEPPSHVVIMILTTDPEKIPATILGRCSRAKLAGVTVDECTKLLVKVVKAQGLGKAGVNEEHLVQIVKATGAHPRNALHALDQVYTMVLDAKATGQAIHDATINAFIKDVAGGGIEDVAAQIFRRILTGKPGGALRSAEKNFAEADQLLTKLTEMMRQAMLCSISPKLVDPYFTDLFDDEMKIFTFTMPKLDKEKDRHLEARTVILDAYACFTRLRIDTSNYTVPIGEVIGETIARSSLLIQVFLKGEGGFVTKKAKKNGEAKEAQAGA